MSRTDELAKGGARRVGGGGGQPFVKWGNEYAWLEGEVQEMWEGNYGPVLTVYVENLSENGLVAVSGEGAEQERIDVTIGDTVNVGCNYAALKHSVDEHLVGRKIHVAFEGWGVTKSQQRFRQFTLLDLSGEAPSASRQPKTDGKPILQKGDFAGMPIDDPSIPSSYLRSILDRAPDGWARAINAELERRAHEESAQDDDLDDLPF